MYIVAIYIGFQMLLFAGSFVLLLLSRRNPKILRAYNRFLDSILNESTEAKKAAPSEKKEGADDDGKNGSEQGGEEGSALQGVTYLTMEIGGDYYCSLSSIERGGSLGKIIWSAEDLFVGKIKDGDVFSALRAGRTKVFCAPDGNDFDTGAVIYDITVLPGDQGWFADAAMKAVLERKLFSDFAASSLMDRKILSENRAMGITVFGPHGHDDHGIAVQTDRSGQVMRVLFKLSAPKGLAAAEGGLERRMRRINTKGETSLWIHQFIDENRDEVDAYAIIKYDESGKMYLGISRTWRENGDTDEFLRNAPMAERLFSDFFPDKRGWRASLRVDEKNPFFGEPAEGGKGSAAYGEEERRDDEEEFARTEEETTQEEYANEPDTEPSEESAPQSIETVENIENIETVETTEEGTEGEDDGAKEPADGAEDGEEEGQGKRGYDSFVDFGEEDESQIYD